MSVTYGLALGHSFTHRDFDVALACGQQTFLASVGTLAARYLRNRDDIDLVLDSWAWPIKNPQRPCYDAWWQELRGWREGAQQYGNMAYCIAYDFLGHQADTQRLYDETMRRMADRGVEDLPLVPVLQYPSDPATITRDVLEGWAGRRHDLTNGPGGRVIRPLYALGGLVPTKGSVESIEWVTTIAHEIAALIDDEVIPAENAGIHLLGSTRRAYIEPFAALDVPVYCDTSTPGQQAQAGEAALKWGYSPRYGLPRDLLSRSRYARFAFWLCRERDRAGLEWTTPDLEWLEELRGLPTVLKPYHVDIFELPA